jgi:hypothetical protein
MSKCLSAQSLTMSWTRPMRRSGFWRSLSPGIHTNQSPVEFFDTASLNSAYRQATTPSTLSHNTQNAICLHHLNLLWPRSPTNPHLLTALRVFLADIPARPRPRNVRVGVSRMRICRARACFHYPRTPKTTNTPKPLPRVSLRYPSTPHRILARLSTSVQARLELPRALITARSG